MRKVRRRLFRALLVLGVVALPVATPGCGAGPTGPSCSSLGQPCGGFNGCCGDYVGSEGGTCAPR